jgi:hypothetical protein
VGQWFYHWIYLDAWCPIWPNLAASLIIYVFLLVKMRSITKLHEEQVKLHDELKALHTEHHHEHMRMLGEIRKK